MSPTAPRHARSAVFPSPRRWRPVENVTRPKPVAPIGKRSERPTARFATPEASSPRDRKTGLARSRGVQSVSTRVASGSFKACAVFGPWGLRRSRRSWAARVLSHRTPFSSANMPLRVIATRRPERDERPTPRTRPRGPSGAVTPCKRVAGSPLHSVSRRLRPQGRNDRPVLAPTRCGSVQAFSVPSKRSRHARRAPAGCVLWARRE